MPQFLTYFADELITVSSPFGCHHLLTYCTISPCQLTTFPFFTLYRSSVTLSSQHPSQATWTCHLGCLGRMCSLPPLPSYPVSSICNFSSFKPSLSAWHPSQATMACHLGCLGGVTLVIHLSGTLQRLHCFFFSVHAWVSLYLCRWVSIFFFVMIYVAILSSSLDSVIIATV